MDKQVELVNDKAAVLKLEVLWDEREWVAFFQGTKRIMDCRPPVGALLWLEGFAAGQRSKTESTQTASVQNWVRTQESLVLGLKSSLSNCCQLWAHVVVGLGASEYGDAVIHEGIRRFAKEHGAL